MANLLSISRLLLMVILGRMAAIIGRYICYMTTMNYKLQKKLLTKSTSVAGGNGTF